MDCSNKTNYLDSSLQLLNWVTSIPLFFFGLTCNILALWVFSCKVKKRTETTVFMVNLIISDILIVLTFPYRVYIYMFTLELGNYTCKILLNIYYINRYMSILNITAIALDRYIAIKHPLKFQNWRSPKKAVITCCVLWLLLIVAAVINTLYSKEYILNSCFQKINTEPFAMALVFVVVGFSIPMIIISFCSAQVISTLRTKDFSDPSEKQAMRKARNIIVSNLVVFVVCFFPVHIGYTLRFVTNYLDASCDTRENINIYIHVSTFAANANCVLDCVCYFFAAREFWESMFMR
ncbi:G-protein coupled receptor 35-like [Pelodytes ibericus]